jgi:hypothetical protein
MSKKRKSQRKKSKRKSQRKRNSCFFGLLGDMCPIGSSVNEAENNKTDYKERYELKCYKNCGFFESTKDYYGDNDPRLKGNAVRICNGNMNDPKEEVKRK